MCPVRRKCNCTPSWETWLCSLISVTFHTQDTQASEMPGWGVRGLCVEARADSWPRILCMVHSHLLTWLSNHKTLVWKTRAAERSELTEADAEEAASQVEWTDRDSEEISRGTFPKCWTTHHITLSRGSGACQLLCDRTPSSNAEQLQLAHTHPPLPLLPSSCNWVKSADLWVIILSNRPVLYSPQGSNCSWVSLKEHRETI